MSFFFRWFGICAGLILLVAATLLAEPPEADSAPQSVGFRANLFSRPFGLVCAGMFAGTFAGLLIIGNLLPLTMQAGLSESEATVAVSVFAAGNALGRVVWGAIFDRVGYICIALVVATGILLMLNLDAFLPKVVNKDRQIQRISHV